MSAFTIYLILASTVMHAGWNLMTRHGRNEVAFIQRMLRVSLLVCAGPALVGLAVPGLLSRTAMVTVLGSGLCCGAYYLGLARAYASGDFTTVYPAARALPVLIVGLGDVLRGRLPTGMGWLGMALVAIGCLLVPLESLRDVRLNRYLNRSSLWVLLTALGTVGYSMLDKIGLESLPPGPGRAAIYCSVFVAMSSLAFTAMTARCRTAPDTPVDPGWLRPGLASVLNFAAYWLILWVYQMVERASYVVAFRQFSIVIGVVLAFVMFREPGRLVRTTGALVITGGLVILKVWGG